MLPAPAYVMSDAHLGFATRDVERSLLRFLDHLHGRAGSLVINGDLFEFWFEWRHVIPRGTFRVLSHLADLREAGVPILMIGGNHDCWGGDVLRQDVGVDYRVGAWEGSLGGWRTHVEHGDGLRPEEDRRYRALRRVLRHPLSIRLFRWLHPDIGSAIARRSSHTSRNYIARDGGAGLRRVATERLGESRSRDAGPIELVIYGHSHVAELLRVQSRAGSALSAGSFGVYANAGSWLDDTTYLRITPERIELRRWDGSGEGVNLNALDRVAEKALA